MPPRILFVPIHGTSLLEMLPIAQKLDSDGIFEPLFFIYCDIQKRHTKLLDENEIKYIKPKNWRSIVSQTEPRYNLNHTKDVEIFESVDFNKRTITKLLSWDWFSFLFYKSFRINTNFCMQNIFLIFKFNIIYNIFII